MMSIITRGGLARPSLGEHWTDVAIRSLAVIAALASIGFLLARAPLVWCVLGWLAVTGGCILLLRPALAVYLLAFTVPFGSLWQFNIAGLSLGPSELLLGVVVATWCMRTVSDRHLQIRRSPLTWAILAYLATLLLSLLPAQDLVSGLKELFKWASFLLVYLYVASSTRLRESLSPAQYGHTGTAVSSRWLVACLLSAGILQALLGIYQFLYQVGPLGFLLFDRYMRASGTFGQPNPYGGYLGLLLPLAFITVLTQARDALAAIRKGTWGPLLLWALALAASVLLLVALVMSWSRGALLGLLGGLALTILAFGRRVWLPLLVIVTLLWVVGFGPLALLPTGFVGRALEVTGYLGTQDLAAVEIDDDNFAVIERMAHWYAAWRMFDQRPWGGVGAGQYALVYPLVALPRWQDPLGHAHNYYLHIMAEGGLLGLTGYLVFTLAALLYIWQRARQVQGWPRTIALGVLGMWGHLLAHSLFDNLYVHGMYLILGMCLGLVVSLPPAQATPHISRDLE